MRTDPNKLQERICRERKNAIASGKIGGDTVFTVLPGSTLAAAGSDINKKIWDSGGNSGLGNMIALVGCTAYLIPDDPIPHATNFSFLIGRHAQSSGVLPALPADPTSVPISDLTLIPWTVGGVSGAN
jgi:hypothetical protein